MLACVPACIAFAAEVIAEGRAPIIGGDIEGARQAAVKRALGWAATSSSAFVSTQAKLERGAVSETTHLRATACTSDARIVSERIHEGEISVAVATTINSGSECSTACEAEYLNTLVVTGIALEHPEQLLRNESSSIAYVTGNDIARAARATGRVLTVEAESSFPYVSPDRAPRFRPASSNEESIISELARTKHAQYLVSGVWRDLSRHKVGGVLGVGSIEQRNLVIEVFLHDGATGDLLAAKLFARRATGEVTLPAFPGIDRPEFRRTDIGREWVKLFAEIGHWLGQQSACMPFIARVIRTEGDRITVDAGATSRLTDGTELRIHRILRPAVKDRSGALLGSEKLVGARLKLRNVYPAFSIGEFAEADFERPRVAPDDLLYLQ